MKDEENWMGEYMILMIIIPQGREEREAVSSYDDDYEVKIIHMPCYNVRADIQSDCNTMNRIIITSVLRRSITINRFPSPTAR